MQGIFLGFNLPLRGEYSIMHLKLFKHYHTQISETNTYRQRLHSVGKTDPKCNLCDKNTQD